ncbi:hypothetical protein [Sphingobium sp.]|uniref:hypothetical protein n=1 Tax=Sphingobium sp. TaxID=1912891 RepID=UPI0025F58812|nr:hypothetical protein [Sphingobium sp.]
MEVKEAIAIAKSYITDIFGPEGAFNVGLEEVQFDGDSLWSVTIGFSRPWDRPAVQNALLPQQEKRTYKIVEINDNSERVVGVKNRMIDSIRTAL